MSSETPESIPVVVEQSEETPEKRKRYKQKFAKRWLENPEFKEWITKKHSSDAGEEVPYCIACNKHLSLAKTAIRRHLKSRSHLKNSASSSSDVWVSHLLGLSNNFVQGLPTAATMRTDHFSAVTTIALQFVEFVNHCPSPFHVVDYCRRQLLEAGFKQLDEREHWEIAPNQKYFVTRNQSTIAAFAVGGRYKPGNGFSIVGAHTDSPCLKVKPNSRKVKEGYMSVGVECYGGGIWHTWFDRDLTLAGRVLVKHGDCVVHRLVHIRKAILKIPNIAIHLFRQHNESFGPNKETELVPILATKVQEELLREGPVSDDGLKHHSLLMNVLARELGVLASHILDMDLCLVDTQPATIGGALDEFVFSPRIDNQANCFTSLNALIDSCQNNSLDDDPNIRSMLLFDNEEVGSNSAQGAGSSLTEWLMRRLSGPGLYFEESVPKSFMISADQAHAVHPNYASKHEDNHKAAMHQGPVLKFNCNQKYATTAVTASILRMVAERAEVPLQDIVVRNDSSCGSTIGPILASKLGLRTVDIGSPQLSMHSIRETCCSTGIFQLNKLFKEFYQSFPDVDSKFFVDNLKMTDYEGSVEIQEEDENMGDKDM